MLSIKKKSNCIAKVYEFQQGLQAKLMYPGNADRTLGFVGHLVSPTASEAKREGRPTISIPE